MLPLTNLHPPRSPILPFLASLSFCREFGLLLAPETRMNRRGNLCTMNKRDHFVDSASWTDGFAGFEPQNDRFRSGQSSCPLNRRTILRPAAVLTRLEVRPGATGLYFDPAHHASPGSAPFRARTPQRADSVCDHMAIDVWTSTSQVEH